jgi:molybdenum cofactor biosynthesis enzyme MoaA
LAKFDWFEDNSQFEKIYKHIDKVERIHIVGGEPLIIEHQEFLQKFVELGVAKNIVISYNSNLTTLPREIINCWKEFKKIYLCVSVDGYKDINEFIRFPMKWDKLENNLREVNELAINQGNISIQIHTTFSSLNCLVVTEFLDWVNTISQELTCIEAHPMINYVFSPSYFDPVHLPKDIKEQAYQSFLNWEATNQEYLNKFGSTDRLDMLKSYFTKIVREDDNPKLFKECVARIQRFESIRGYAYPGPKLLDNAVI